MSRQLRRGQALIGGGVISCNEVSSYSVMIVVEPSGNGCPLAVAQKVNGLAPQSFRLPRGQRVGIYSQLYRSARSSLGLPFVPLAHAGVIVVHAAEIRFPSDDSAALGVSVSKQRQAAKHDGLSLCSVVLPLVVAMRQC